MSARSFTLNGKEFQGNIRVYKQKAGEGERLAIFLHGHQVAFKNEQGDITLSSCGYLTPTTKTAINRFLTLVGDDHKVLQVGGNWYLVDGENNKVNFTDNMVIKKSKLEKSLQ